MKTPGCGICLPTGATGVRTGTFGRLTAGRYGLVRHNVWQTTAVNNP